MEELSALQWSSSGGYMPHEVIDSQKFSLKYDVYSFGILLLEIVSGKRNRSSGENGSLSYLKDEALVAYHRRNLTDLVDKRLLSHGFEQKEVMVILNLAIDCINGSPDVRPTMSKIVHDLNMNPHDNTSCVSITKYDSNTGASTSNRLKERMGLKMKEEGIQSLEIMK
ncbi:Tyrosine-protein kinase [Parasponia andersonii]|uniref:Tyrosine-protein kinase n=1 Tax=Parasponia andersonii TaxID=3476 RepID=A0A2P5AKL4_PARAD|nr:Tyrosine-protein kinase [Parasponia andersonii]